uniref:Uncharacterized protein n=1 Tax=Theropithecus gelada TaxID=9565 RepID=A0A8D2ETA2_THEGE
MTGVALESKVSGGLTRPVLAEGGGPESLREAATTGRLAPCARAPLTSHPAPPAPVFTVGNGSGPGFALHGRWQRGTPARERRLSRQGLPGSGRLPLLRRRAGLWEALSSFAARTWPPAGLGWVGEGGLPAGVGGYS